MNERKTGENGAFDIQSRVENLLWAVSGDYGMDMAADVKAWEKSPYIPLYEAVVQGIFRKYFDREKYQAFFARKVYQGMIPSVLEALGRLCIDSAVWKKAVRERPGVENLRKTAFQDILEKDSLRLTHTDWGYLENCYLRKDLYGEKFQGRTEKILDRIAAIEDTDSVEDICRCLEEIYWEAYENRLAENFKGLDREVKSSDWDMKEYTDKEKAREEEKEEAEEAPIYYPQLWRKVYPCQSPAGTSAAGLHRNTQGLPSSYHQGDPSRIWKRQHKRRVCEKGTGRKSPGAGKYQTDHPPEYPDSCQHPEARPSYQIRERNAFQ